jgi:hypothetical protein
VRRAEVGNQHDARALVEREHRRGAPTGGSASTGFIHQLVREQRIEALRNGGAGETSAANQIGACHRLAVTDQAEQRSRAGHETGIVIESAIVGSKAEVAAGLDRIVNESSASGPTNRRSFTPIVM